MRSQQPEPGQTFAGYMIDSRLGRGGMGTVYLATHERLRRKVALKVLSTELADDPVFRERFIRESQVAAALDHPNVVPIYDADEHDGVLYIAMRYVEGTDLRTLLLEKRRLSPERTLQIVEQIAGALDVAHATSLVHRDVKPANILIAEPGGKAFLSDFGLAKASTDGRMTRTGSFLGTVDYCAPEQIEGKPLDGRADVYALGCVVFECLTGGPPFARETDVATIKAHLQDPPPRVTATRPELPQAVDAVLATALAKAPAERFGSAGALANALRLAFAPSRSTVPAETLAPPVSALQAATVPHPVASPPPQPPPDPGRSRHRWLIAAAVVAVAAVAAAALAIALTRGSSKPHVATDRFGSELTSVVKPLVPAQRSVNAAATGLDTGLDSLSTLKSAASSLQRSALLMEGKLSTLAPKTALDRAGARNLRTALSRQEAYASSVLALSAPLNMTSATATALQSRAGDVDAAYLRLDGAAPKPCCPAMPAAATASRHFLDLVTTTPQPTTTPGQGVGVPAVYTGLFTSVDRLERCNATAAWVYCSAAPSDKAVKLTVGVGATDVGTRTSVDRGGNSMPEGTSFRTPDGKIQCASSTRGMSCTDTTTGNGFVIGDYKVIIVAPGASPAPSSVGVPVVYSGRFVAVDRRERCFATDEYVVCNAYPSGKAVRLVLGGSATYEGVLGTQDKGGPSMPEGTSFRTPAGTIACGSSSHGITCTDQRTGNGFTIGDYYVRVTNGGSTQTY